MALMHPWDNQIEIIEQDPTKGMKKKNSLNAGPSLVRRFDFCIVQFVFRSNRVILFHDELS
jgi:hypothetical protein